MFTLVAVIVYKDAGGGLHTEKYTHLASSICEGVNFLQDMIESVEERNHWEVIDVCIKNVTIEKGEC